MEVGNPGVLTILGRRISSQEANCSSNLLANIFFCSKPFLDHENIAVKTYNFG